MSDTPLDLQRRFEQAMGGQIFTMAAAAPQKHGHQADPGKDKKKTRRAEAAGLRSVAAVCERGI
jgi:hypothetical protein